MRKITLLFIFTLLTTTGCSLKTLNAVVPDGNSTLVSNIQYGSLNRHHLDIHLPKNIQTNTPVIVFFYGGRWQSGERLDYQFVGQALAKRGFITVVPDYRLFPDTEFPGFIVDAAKATKWTLNNIQQYGGDTSQVYVMGHSAGAHIAAMLVTNKQYLSGQHVDSASIAGFIGLSGPYNFNITDEDIKQVFRQANTFNDTQPIHFVDGSEPPHAITAWKKGYNAMAEEQPTYGGKNN